MEEYLSEHFKLEEFVRSSMAETRKIDNTPSEQVIENLRQLCREILEPLRRHTNRAITINSGYRCQELNRVVGGVRESQHITGEAADIPFNRDWACWIADHTDFDQLILERKGDVKWLHVSCRRDKSRNRHQILTILAMLAFFCVSVLSSCASRKVSGSTPVPVTEVIRNESQNIRNNYDSIVIYHDRFQTQSADTVFLREESREFRTRVCRDTVRIVQRDSIPYEVCVVKTIEVPRPRSTLDRISYAALFLLAAVAVYRLIRLLHPFI